ncbi:MAG: 3,4-dihydroxy-2-butanone-4-phosphate synthase [Geminicoccaceae bacterium]|nr:3,4-dihydroxy-2-butanone-4-phosphate synthase [Geminicoccaceae bacterium]
MLDSIPDAIRAIAAGELVVVVDDTDRENEGDLIVAAGKASAERIAFMIRHTSGILCVPMIEERAKRLSLAPMVADNIDPLRTAFTVSVDYRVGLTTGISAEERSATARALANDNCSGTDFIRPGHMFPLIARPGGVLTRSGHTEAATDLARLAGLPPLGVLAEIVNDDGTVKRLPELVAFAREHGLKIVSIEDLIQYRIRTECFVEPGGEEVSRSGPVPVTVRAYRTPFDPLHHVAIIFGDIGDGRDVPCRVHREQPVAELMDMLAGRQSWLEVSRRKLEQLGRGVLILVRNPLAHEPPHDADALPQALEDGERHGSARRRVERWREIGVGAQILRDLGIGSIALLATREQHYVGLSGFGIEITRMLRIDDEG